MSALRHDVSDSNFADKPSANDYLRITTAQEVRNRGRGNCRRQRHQVNSSPQCPPRRAATLSTRQATDVRFRFAWNVDGSIIAGRPAPTDGFIGVAPDARILSLRQTSEAFQPVGSRTDPNDPNTTHTAGSLRSLARAVVHAANIGAQVINISEAACYKVTRPINESGLGAAINYAVNVKGAVIIVAAGNTGQDCTQNPPPDPAIPADPRGWNQVQTIVSPAWYSPLVLTVGGIAQNGQPSNFSMNGPWVGAAAPAENIIALGYDGAPVSALQGQDGPIPITGTSFAAAYVSGLAALLKQRFPGLTAAQIINRITATARHPGGGVDNEVGAGVIDPVAALTWDVPAGPATVPYRVKQLPPPVYVPPPDRGPITAVVVTGAGLALALGLGALARRALRRR